MKLHVGIVVVAAAFISLNICFASSDEDILNSAVESITTTEQDFILNVPFEFESDINANVRPESKETFTTVASLAQIPTTTEKDIVDTTTTPTPVVLTNINKESLNDTQPAASIQKPEPEPIEHDDGPIILRPSETSTVGPILIPAPSPVTVTCTYCGKTQLWDRPQPCPHCSVCGHAMTPQIRGKSARVNANIEPVYPLSSQPQILHTISGSGIISRNHSSTQLPGTLESLSRQRYVLMHAAVNLNRRELLKRRLNFQRVKEYRKSIGDIQEEQPKRSVQFPERSIKNLVSRKPDLLITRPSAYGPSALTRSITSWIFGNQENNSFQGNGTQSRASTRGQQNMPFFKCPYAKNLNR